LNEGILFLAAPLTAYWLARRLIDLYQERGAVKSNYRGRSVAPALGPALLLAYLSTAVAAIWLEDDRIPWLQVTVLFVGVSLYGLWDDFMEETTSGFKGHLKVGLKGALSAGLLKVITALLVALLFIGALPLTLTLSIIALLAILLSANGVNLLDRRPGRALKVFFFLGLLLIFIADSAAGVAVLLLPIMAAALVLAPFDFSAEGMLGDCGANLLGAVLGVGAVLFMNPAGQLLFVAAWGVVNIVSERVSFSTIVEENRILHYLDTLGRGEEKLT